ncbi:hypothetical protein [Gracilibacillus sp. YIM 98692]|uniref:hypothetical protein n=1 Tax=Gracilibacillus sp. YIM 98692 TaxID=2663532 RepID=UPI0013D0A379|nr:hypothetical protein [Gracilibacillus sp. YIM 98692]
MDHSEIEQLKFESRPSPNIIPDWYEEHKQARKLGQPKRSQAEKEKIAAESDRLLEEYLKEYVT